MGSGPGSCINSGRAEEPQKGREPQALCGRPFSISHGGLDLQRRPSFLVPAGPAPTQPGPRQSSLTPTAPLGPRSDSLLTPLILSPKYFWVRLLLAAAPPALRGILPAAKMLKALLGVPAPSDHPPVLPTGRRELSTGHPRVRGRRCFQSETVQ